jgi:hypothetical protein
MSGFRWHGSLVLALLVLAGCTKGSQGPVAVGAAALARHEAIVANANGPALAARHSFAHLPDRGELIAYPGKIVRQDGAYTWHRTDLSEAHALHAIAGGHLRVTTPSGALLDFQYDNHVEHPSGDWTWVGHIAGHPDQQTILTFGEHAAFGSIAQPGTLPLRNGVGWLVETDPRKVAGIINAATRPQRPDFLVPPKAAVPSASPRRAAAAPVLMASAPSITSAATSTATTVDLVLGYTPAFASDNGGTSGAVTHLNYLVDVTNVAYVNSQIDAKVRLVATVPVTYPDATSNDSALGQLTGYDTTSNTMTTPDPAFNALRAAREQYGADMVSLVRSFRDPENGGCGIGWLIGGGRQPIDQSDSYFAYSVVSDGTHLGTDGKTYYCLDETLAHELGHGMGAAHDVATAKGSNGILDNNEYGAFSYSFGYKSTSGNFYTVMAYGDTGQQIERIFSDPRSTFCGGAPCGVIDQADNSRTLTQTIPTVATFRATVVPHAGVVSDYNGDLRSDILMTKDGVLCFLFMNGQALDSSSCPASAGAGYRIISTADFNGDGHSDILWTNGNYLKMWFGDGAGGVSTQAVGGYDGSWTMAGAADMNSDGKADILMTKDGVLCILFMNGTSLISSSCPNGAGVGFRIIKIADFNGDNLADILWTNGYYLKMWFGNGAGGFSTQEVGGYDGTWTMN